MATIVYLDVDDEITSAAARIRGATDKRVALVLPFGSRLATSRINFRLLAREAMLHGRRLGIVAPDASARAIAASAGLPVFHSVDEYDGSVDGGAVAKPEAATATSAAADDRSATVAAAAAGAAVAGSDTGLAAGRKAAGASSAKARSSPTAPASQPPRPASSNDRVSTATVPAGVAAASAAAEADDATRLHEATTVRSGPRPASPHAEGGSGSGTTSTRSRLGRPRRAVVGIVAALVALALLAGGVAAYVLLPAATITVTPRLDPIGPLTIDVRADPTVTAVDPEAGLIPAVAIPVTAHASGEFPATGTRTEKTAATGSVRFDSINTVGPVFVPAGTRLSTLDGVVFATTRAVSVPPARVSGNAIAHGFAETPVRALKEGPEGNVDAGTITQVPDNLRIQQVSAENGGATTGGRRRDFTLVSKQDVDAVVAKLTAEVQGEFASQSANPDGVPPGATVFAESATGTDPVITPNPSTLVGKQIDSFNLDVVRNGTVLAVDETPLEQIARTRLAQTVAADHRLVESSVQVDVGGSTVEPSGISFPVLVRASQVRPVDPAALKSAVLGKSKSDAMATLSGYGDASL